MNGLRTILRALASLAVLGGGEARAAEFNLEYNASILSVVELGKLGLRGKIGPSAYNAAATVQTSGLAALFDDTRISASSAGAVGASGLGWSSYSLSHAYAKKHRNVTMTRAGGVVTAKIQPAYGNLGSPPASEAQKAGARDPVSTMAELGRSVAASGKCAGAFATFDGKQYYTLTLSPKAKGQYRGGGYNGEALVCALRYAPIAGFKMTAAERAKIPVAEIWFAKPKAGFAAPLRIEVPTPIGPARLDLAKGTGI
jgi:hypothetical protein